MSVFASIARRLFVVSAMLLLAACGGGGGGGATNTELPNIGDLRISASSVTFDGETGGAVPSTSWLTVTFSDPRIYDVVAGVPSGTSLPSWLGINLTGNRSPMTLSIGINTTNLSPGTYSATIRVGTRYISPSGVALLDVRDIPVTYNVSPLVTLSASPSPLLLSRNEPAVPGAQNVNIAFNGGTPSSWTPSVSYVDGNGWLTVTPSGNALSVQPNSLPPGQYQANIQINYTLGNLNKTGTIPVTYTVNPAISTPGSVSFLIDGTSTAGALSQAITIGANTAGGASPGMNWSASVNQPWLVRSPASGVTGAGNNLTLTLVASELVKLSSGTHSAALTITTSEPGVAPRTVPVTLNFNLPTVSYVAPYIATAGVPGTAIVRGAGFNSLPTPVVRVGTAAATSVARINDTELRINYSAITNSSYPFAQMVYVENALGLQLTRAQLVTVDVSSYTTTRIDSLGIKTNVLYNGERKDIYVGNLTNKTLERYRYNGSGWTKTELSLPNIKYSPTDAIIISPDGKLIATFDDDHLYLVDLDTFTLSKTVTFAPRYANWLGTIAFTNNGKILAADANQWSNIFSYDVLAETTTSTGSFVNWWGPRVLASINGSRVLVTASPGASVFDATTNTYSTPPSALGNNLRSTNIDASRFISQYNSDYYLVFDYGNNTPVSSLSSIDHTKPVLSRSGTAFFALDFVQKLAQRYNASSATVLNSVSVSDLLSFGDMTLSEDEAILFIATDKEIKILPVP